MTHSQARCLMRGMLVVLLAVSARSGRSDELTLRTVDGGTEVIQGKILGSGQRAVAIELPNGSLRIVAEGALLDRKQTGDPVPITPEEIQQEIETEFGRNLVRTEIEDPFVVSMVLMGPIEQRAESKVTGFLKKASRFMKNMEGVFLKYTRQFGLDAAPPTHPLVVLIFESDKDFEKYADSITQGEGLSSKRISGFYNQMTNYLAIRMTECASFEVPLHEAIHQQVYNRGVLQRVSQVPVWFNEGLATGFEANGERINAGPTKVHSRYSLKISQMRQVDWETIVEDDSAFRGDVLAGEAYCNAWGLHWFLATEFRPQYTEYVKRLGGYEPLVVVTDEQRKKDFQECIGQSIPELRERFERVLQSKLRRSRSTNSEQTRPGIMLLESSLGEAEMKATTLVNLGGVMRAEGRLRNMSPIRALTFYVAVETDSGLYTDWLLPNIATNKVVRLNPQPVQKLMRGGRGGPSRTFRVRIESALPDSVEAKQWASGQRPVGTFGG